MLLNAWSLALMLTSALVLVLLLLAGRTGVRVLRFWDPKSDSNRQIELESEIWLTSTLVEYALGFQILSLVLYVLAADRFGEVIAGAMCATGTLLADPYGMPTLAVKLIGVFLYGLWIALHQLDIRSPAYPLVRTKYRLLLGLLPLLVADNVLQLLYIAGLKPDIITSCCAVVFGGSPQNNGFAAVHFLGQEGMFALFYAAALVLLVAGIVLARRWRTAWAALYAAGWGGFFGLALMAITTLFSPFVYAMPHHRCPFCLLKPEYHYFGFLLYGTLLPAAFFGMVPALVMLAVTGRPELAAPFQRFRGVAVRLSVALLLLFVLLASCPPLLYWLAGGER